MGTKQCNRSEKGAFERVSVAPASELFQVIVGFEQLFTHIIFHENVAFTLYSGTLVAGGRMFPPIDLFNLSRDILDPFDRDPLHALVALPLHEHGFLVLADIGARNCTSAISIMQEQMHDVNGTV